MQHGSGKFVAYLRLSKSREGRAALGLEAQREAVRQFVAARRGTLLSPEYVEVESGKGEDNRPELHKALRRCQVTGATLVVAKLDRLSRHAAFLMTLRDSGADFVTVDLPEANTMTVGVMAVVAQHERETIAERTRAALAAAKARGTVLGGRRAGAADIAAYQRKGTAAAREKAREAAELRREALEALAGLSLNAMAARLNADSVTTSRGGKWTATAVRRTLNLLELT